MKKNAVFIAIIFLTLLLMRGNKAMAERNIQMGQRNADNTDWDRDYPITKAENVKMEDGSNVALRLENDTNSLIEKTKQSQTSLMYARAVEEMYNLPKGCLTQALSAINGGTLKLAIWGDSISGNFDQNGTDDAYAARLAKAIKDALPNVTVTYQNFAIGGQTIYHAASGSFVGGDTNTDTTFKTEWSVNGKSWRDHVKDFQPDLLIVAFGMNESITGYQADELEAAYLDTLLTDTLTWTKKPSIVAVTTILPTKNPLYYGQSNNLTRAVSRATRIMAKSKGIAVADASRLEQILRDGKDDVTRATTSEFDFESYANWSGDKAKFTQAGTTLVPTNTNAYVCNDRDFYNGAITFSITPTIMGSGGQAQIKYRYTTDLGYLHLVIGAGAGSGYVRLYETNTASSDLLQEVVGMNISLSTHAVKIITEGINHKIYLDDVLILNVDTYKDLHDGGVMFGSDGTPPTLSALTINYNDPISGEPLYTELELLGDYNGPQSGNGINHPSGLGHSLFYLPAFYGVINCLNNNVDIDTMVGASLGYVAGWTLIGTYNPITVTKKLGEVKFYGTIFASTTYTAGTSYPIFTLPERFRPVGIVNMLIIAGTGTGVVTIQSTGVVSITPSVTVTTGQPVTFEGNSFTK